MEVRSQSSQRGNGMRRGEVSSVSVSQSVSQSGVGQGVVLARSVGQVAISSESLVCYFMGMESKTVPVQLSNNSMFRGAVLVFMLNAYCKAITWSSSISTQISVIQRAFDYRAMSELDPLHSEWRAVLPTQLFSISNLLLPVVYSRQQSWAKILAPLEFFQKMPFLTENYCSYKGSIRFRSRVITGHLRTLQYSLCLQPWVLFEVCLGVIISCCNTNDSDKDIAFRDWAVYCA